MISKKHFLQLVSKNSTYWKNLLINRSNAVGGIITTAVLSILFGFYVIFVQSVSLIVIYFLQFSFKICNRNMGCVNKRLLQKKGFKRFQILMTKTTSVNNDVSL